MTSNAPLGPPWTVLKILTWTQQFFSKRGLEAPRFEAEILLADVLNLDRLQLYLRFDQPLMDAELDTFRAYVKRRAAGEPVAYILGRRAFYSIEVNCDPRALIPRPDSEVLVEVVLERLPEETKTLIDVGTGTGAIGLSIATEVPTLNVILTDISVDALDLAKTNVQQLSLTQRVGLLQGDLLDAVPSKRSFEAVVSNPPYVSDTSRDQLADDVVRFEPALALYGGPDGLDLIRRLADQAFQRLPSGGLFAVEIGFDQGDSAPDLFRSTGFTDVELRKDYNGHPRVVSGFKP